MHSDRDPKTLISPEELSEHLNEVFHEDGLRQAAAVNFVKKLSDESRVVADMELVESQTSTAVGLTLRAGPRLVVEAVDPKLASDTLDRFNHPDYYLVVSGVLEEEDAVHLHLVALHRHANIGISSPVIGSRLTRTP